MIASIAFHAQLFASVPLSSIPWTLFLPFAPFHCWAFASSRTDLSEKSYRNEENWGVARNILSKGVAWAFYGTMHPQRSLPRFGNAIRND